MPETVLLTGIGGSIGCHTFAHLMHNTDWNVVGIDSFRHKGLTDRIEVMLEAHPGWSGRLRIFTHDLIAPLSDMLGSKIGHVDYLINMASLSDVQASIDDPGPFIGNNIALVTNVLDYARKLDGLKAFIQISTDEVYGPSGESDGHAEWSPLVPSNPYAASKAAQEMIAIAYWRSYGVPLIITNTMNNFGEMQQASKYPAIVQSRLAQNKKITVHGTPNNVGSRYYLHSRNHADALLYLLQHTTPYRHRDGEIDRPDRYNIVGDRRIDNRELVDIIARLMDAPAPKVEYVDFHAARPGHDRHYGLDGAKLAHLGWKSPVDFETSLKQTLDWTQAHAEWHS